MSVDRFRFVSPGIFINEVDKSQVPVVSVPRTGPAIIGHARKGPAMRPVTVRNFSEFVALFGDPVAGAGSQDVWRNGNTSAPSYAAYAAQAYLANNSPVHFVRLLGDQDPAGSATAGWTVNAPSITGNGVYGLFLFNSASGGEQVSGTLAAKWYLAPTVQIALSGTKPFMNTVAAQDPFNLAGFPGLGVCAVGNPVSVGSKKEFKVSIKSGSAVEIDSSFNFEKTSGRYIRKVFNTNPQSVNSNLNATANLRGYWLGETYERTVRDFFDTADDFSDVLGIILPMGNSSVNAGDFARAFVTPATPPIISQDLSQDYSTFDVNNQQELFTVHALNDAEYSQRSYKISFTDIKASPNPDWNPWGSFTLEVRALLDTDENPVILEQYNEINLNPNSQNYIGRRIGDSNQQWDSTNKKYRTEGQYPNQSKLIRVAINSSVENASNSGWLPFGFKGIPQPAPFNIMSGSNICTYQPNNSGSADATLLVSPSASANNYGNVAAARYKGGIFMNGGNYTPAAGANGVTASIIFPPLPQRVSSSDGQLMDPRNAYFGIATNKSVGSLVPDETIIDLARIMFGSLDADSTGMQRGPGFSLDDLVLTGTLGNQAFHSGAFMPSTVARMVYDQASGSSLGARSAGTSLTAISSSYAAILDKDFNRFTVPLIGGFDGWDITEKEPMNNTRALGGTSAPVSDASTNAMYYTALKAIDTIADPEVIDINLGAIPGIWQRNVTNHLIRTCEDRADAMAVIDLEGGYTASAESTADFASRRGSVTDTITYTKNRAFNSSYAAAYYPWVQVRDAISGVPIWMPPSVTAIGTYASSERRSELWFAPAGFNRGGLSQGAAGIPVVNVLDKLVAKERDNLYEVNVNPIASFPAEGIVIFGQKTLQARPSALDRVNVRRLMIYLKKQISRISANILFDPNIQVTWDRFLAEVNPLLRSVKSRFGLSDYRVVLDKTTTTAELIDRNIMYAKVFLKPTRAIEFIALDFIITRTGASFDD